MHLVLMRPHSYNVVEMFRNCFRTKELISKYGAIVTQTYQKSVVVRKRPTLKSSPKIKQANYSQRISGTMDSHWIKTKQRDSRNACNLGLSIDGFSGIYFTPDVWGGQLRFVGFPETPSLILLLMKVRRESWQKVEKRKTKLIASVSAINWVWDT